MQDSFRITHHLKCNRILQRCNADSGLDHVFAITMRNGNIKSRCRKSRCKDALTLNDGLRIGIFCISVIHKALGNSAQGFLRISGFNGKFDKLFLQNHYASFPFAQTIETLQVAHSQQIKISSFSRPHSKACI